MKSSFFSDLEESLPSESKKSESSFFSDLKEQPSKLRSILTAPLKGAASSAQSINPLFPRGPISPEMGERLLEENLPTRPEHDYLVRAGKLAPYVALGPEGIAAKGAQLAGGTIAGELAKSGGLGETGQSISEAVGMGASGLMGGLAKLGLSAFAKGVEKLPSGLTKLKALSSKFPKFGTISKERHDAVVQKLDKEAANIAKTSIEKHLPITKEIEKGVDFEKNFQTGFGNLKRSAEKANPTVDITPVSNFFQETWSKYKGIPKPHAEAKKIKDEIRAFSNNPPTSLNNLLKTYRSNNRKISNIYETSRIKGSQKEYVDFLLDMNRNISKSFEDTLPKDSAWMKQFKAVNHEYKSFQDAKKVMADLKGILSESPTYAQIENLSSNPATQRKLSLRMGEEGSKEIIQLAKDLKQTKEALKSVPKGSYSKYDAIFPLYYFIPWIGKYLGIAKAANTARYFTGWLLSTPSRRSAYREAVQSFLKQDIQGYKKATQILLKEMKTPLSKKDSD
jgi:hypothetical protein